MNKKDNKGFSLIELVICIALMAVVTIMSVGIMSMVNSSKLKSAAGTINSALSQTRTYSMTKTGNWRMRVYYSGGKARVDIENQKSGSGWEKHNSYVVESGNEVKVRASGGASNVISLKDDTSNIVEFTFNKSTGAFSNSKIVYQSGAESGIEVNSVIVERGDSDKEVKLVKTTGKHSIE